MMSQETMRACLWETFCEFTDHYASALQANEPWPICWLVADDCDNCPVDWYMCDYDFCDDGLCNLEYLAEYTNSLELTALRFYLLYCVFGGRRIK